LRLPTNNIYLDNEEQDSSISMTQTLGVRRGQKYHRENSSMILRAKTIDLLSINELTKERLTNSILNKSEIKVNKQILESVPQRLVFELTNACNISCVMCGRNAADFAPTKFNAKWFEKFHSIMDKIEEVTLIGWGEPTVHPDFTDMLKTLDKYGVRKYFCTNGMLLHKLKDVVFKNKVDIIAVSIDGLEKTNNRIRRGSNYSLIISSLKDITNIKREKKLSYPYINFVFAAMQSNITELADVVKLAADIGLEEVKVVYLTAFDEKFLPETLYDKMDMVKEHFNHAINVAERLNVKIKLPYLVGEDPAGDKAHKDCTTLWRDFFLGSDGYVRPCMSSSVKLFHIDKYRNFDEMWNSGELQNWRKTVNSENMHESCANCYQSSFANWNKQYAFNQVTHKFSPEWAAPALTSGLPGTDF